jgi:LPS sulfotransferase NodH
MAQCYVDEDTHIDYEMFNHMGVSFRGPRPSSLEDGEYVCCIGGSHTFGRFCQEPYPAILSKKLGIPVLNMGCGGFGISAFVHDNARMNIINRSRAVVIQAMSGRCEDTSLYKSILGCWQEDRETGKRHHNDFFLKELLAEGLYLPRFVTLVKEAEISYIKSHQEFLSKIDVPALFFWFGEKRPEDNLMGEIKDFASMLGSFPHWVSPESYLALNQLFTHNAVCATGPQKQYYFDQAAQCKAAEILEEPVKNLFLGKNPSLWIMGELRSGSTMLCDILNHLMVTEAPVLSEHVRTDNSGGRGFAARHRTKLQSIAWDIHYSRSALAKTISQYPQRKYVFIRRRDKVKQVVSAIVSAKLGQWHVFKGHEEEFAGTGGVEVSDEELLNHYREFNNWNSWIDFFEVLDASRRIVVFYEDLMSDSLGEVRRIASFLGIPCQDREIREAIDSLRTVETSKTRPEYADLEERLRRLVSSDIQSL